MFARLALDTDREALRRLGRAHTAEVRPNDVWSDERADATFDRYLADGNPVFYVVEWKRQVIGYWSATVIENPFTSGVFVNLDLLYVMPEKRGSRAAAVLVKSYDEWINRIKPSDEYVHLTDNIQSSLSKIVERIGFRPLGVTWARVDRGVA